MRLALLLNSMGTDKYLLSEEGHQYTLWKAKALELTLGEIYELLYLAVH
jgi:hypothetical protein